MVLIQERRSLARQRSLLGAKFVCEQPMLSVDCTIRDMTQAGARVSFRGLDGLPTAGWLIAVGQGRAHACETVWRQGRQRGLKFVNTVDVTEPLPGALNYLHRLWLEAAAR